MMDIEAKRIRMLDCCREIIEELDSSTLDAVLADEAMFKARLKARIAMSQSQGYPTELSSAK